MWDGWGSGMGWAGWFAMTLSMIVFWGVLIWLAVWAVRQFGPEARRPSGALAILEERFARGEIDREEFDRRKAGLSAQGRLSLGRVLARRRP